MCGDSNLSKFRNLIDESLRRFTDDVSVTEEREILVTLSQVFRQVKVWIEEVDSGSDDDVIDVSLFGNYWIGLDCENGFECVSEILTHLIVLMTVESRYVKHLVCNVLAVVSEFVAASGSHWEEFVRLLCDCLDLASRAAISWSRTDLDTGARGVSSSSSRLMVVLKVKLTNGDWSVATGVVRVLRDILKCLKSKGDDELVEVFVKGVGSFLSAGPWDLLTEISIALNDDARKSTRADILFQNAVFLGNLLQFFCSLVEQAGVVDAADESVNKHHLVFSTIINLVPKLLVLCFGEQADSVISNSRIFQYFKHKILVLMNRLVVQACPESAVLVSWLQFIHNYFKELLQKPLSIAECNQEDCLEGSPFLSSVSDSEVNCLSYRHLQRQAVFLFLRCSFSLINSKGGSNRKCACASWNLCEDYGSNAELQCCDGKKGLFELYNWLQGHLSTDMVVDNEMYIEKCSEFSKSFLQLYIKEDDILFKVLLQLLSVPFPVKNQVEKEKGSFQDSKGNVCFFVSDLFDPVLLFHLFLAELSYDHQVLLDYLISKDTGTSCAEYLLRCLRKVCDSWSLFVNSPPSGRAINRPSCKKRKVSNVSNFCDSELFASVKDSGASFHRDECNDENKYCGDDSGENFQEAKRCLLSLKTSMESLHKKNLFPYNPRALLKRLMRFQELCLEEEK